MPLERYNKKQKQKVITKKIEKKIKYKENKNNCRHMSCEEVNIRNF